jgi:hypothetical protein
MWWIGNCLEDKIIPSQDLDMGAAVLKRGSLSAKIGRREADDVVLNRGQSCKSN